jgi:hypothetical protein
VLRALDSIEDDMDITLDGKLPHLRSFASDMFIDDWTLHDVGDKPDYRYTVQRHVTPFLVASERTHSSHFINNCAMEHYRVMLANFEPHFSLYECVFPFASSKLTFDYYNSPVAVDTTLHTECSLPTLTR